MAIIKDYETPQGVDGRYHKIIRAEIDALAQSIQIIVAVYASGEARSSGKHCLWHAYQTVPFSALTQDPRDLLYPMLAAYGASYLQGGVPDEEGSGAPGNFEINLTPEAMLPPAPPPPAAPQLQPEPTDPPSSGGEVPEAPGQPSTEEIPEQ
jgi:hypothetical protein